jgi:hypothetical protein
MCQNCGCGSKGSKSEEVFGVLMDGHLREMQVRREYADLLIQSGEKQIELLDIIDEQTEALLIARKSMTDLKRALNFIAKNGMPGHTAPIVTPAPGHIPLLNGGPVSFGMGIEGAPKMQPFLKVIQGGKSPKFQKPVGEAPVGEAPQLGFPFNLNHGIILFDPEKF